MIDRQTQRMMNIVVIFSIITKMIRDINTLYYGIYYLHDLISDITILPFGIYLIKMVMFMFNMIGSLILPGYFVKYILNYSHMEIPLLQYLFKPQLYCALFGIVHYIITLFIK